MFLSTPIFHQPFLQGLYEIIHVNIYSFREIGRNLLISSYLSESLKIVFFDVFRDLDNFASIFAYDSDHANLSSLFLPNSSCKVLFGRNRLDSNHASYFEKLNQENMVCLCFVYFFSSETFLSWTFLDKIIFFDFCLIVLLHLCHYSITATVCYYSILKCPIGEPLVVLKEVKRI